MSAQLLYKNSDRLSSISLHSQVIHSACHLSFAVVYGTITCMRRWLLFILAVLIGTALGVWYGRVIHPVEYTDTAPNTLRGDYKTDYVLMVAESNANQLDASLAIGQLSELSAGTPVEVVLQAILFAERAGYAEQDLLRLRSLLEALQSSSNPTSVLTP